MKNQAWLNCIQFNQDGLLPAIAQDHASGEILMMAWMNAEALALTAQTKTAVYFSRSRQALWYKGETSGHTQQVHDIYLDCDADAIILKVTQIGGIACHTGRQSCFYQRLGLSGSEPDWQTVSPVLKDPQAIYGDPSNPAATTSCGSDKTATTKSGWASGDYGNQILQQLDSVLEERKSASPDSSYVASLYHKGINKILEKVGEEAIEAVIAAKDLSALQKQASSTDQLDANSYQSAAHDLVYEVADVWFHTLVTLAWFNIGSEQILSELARRFGLSGIDEKAARPN